MKIRFHWGVGIAAFYTLFALATIGFVVFAMSQEVELVSDTYYEDALRHDADVAARQRTDALGDAFTIVPRHDDGDVVIHWPREMAPLVRGEAVLYRPSRAASDVSIRLQPDAEGRQIIATDALARGRWQVKVTWSANDVEYRASRDLDLP